MKTVGFLLLMFISSWGWAQTQDSTQTVTKPTFQVSKATRAALLSAALPGAGQVYNKTYWQIKVPIIYTGAAILGYMIRSNHVNYKDFRNAYVLRNDNNNETNPDALYNAYTDENLLRQRDKFRRDRDFMLVLSGLLYVLNIAEAATTAHLNEFSVKDDIGIKIHPQIIPVSTAYMPVGIGLRLTIDGRPKPNPQVTLD